MLGIIFVKLERSFQHGACWDASRGEWSSTGIKAPFTSSTVAGFSQIGPRKRPFDVNDPAISYPLEAETITNSTLILATLVAPAAVIVVGSLLIVVSGKTDVTASIHRKLWEWNTG